jgi:hypothetical protein
MKGGHARGFEAQRAEQENRRSIIILRSPNVERVNWAAATVVLGMTTSADAAEPMVLSEFELDAITAAGVLVDVSSMAAALGDAAAVGTDANTGVFVGDHLAVGVGTTIGQALACCGSDADVAVGSAVVGIGDIVHGTTHSVEYDGRLLDVGLSVGLVVALSFGEHFVTLRHEHVAMLEELRAELANFRVELPDYVSVLDGQAR